MKATKTVAVALLVLGAAACGRRDVPNQTNTTSGEYDRQADLSGAPSPAAPLAPNDLPPAGVHDSLAHRDFGDIDRPLIQQQGAGLASMDESTIAAECDRRAKEKTAAAAPAVPKAKAPAASAAGVDKAGTTSITSGEMNKGSQDGKPSTAPNDTTPLGDGKSGTYTGGEGTYGGKATHGTGTPAK